MSAGCGPTAPANPPDAIFFGGTIYTGVDGQLPATAVSVKDGRIVEVGAQEELLKAAGDKTEKVDLGGAFLYPGFTDAHAHLYGIGEREQTLNLDKVASVAELVQVVGDAAKAAPAGKPLIGRGWIETHWPEKRFPNRADIDAVTGDRPTVLERADGHALLANTAALKAVGLDGKPKSQPSGGRIEVGKDGLPTGMLIDNAMGPMMALATAPSEAQVKETFAKGIAREIGLGWTGVHSHVGRGRACADPQRDGRCGRDEAAGLERRRWRRLRQGHVRGEQGRARHDESDQALYGWRAGFARGAAVGAVFGSCRHQRPAGRGRDGDTGDHEEGHRCGRAGLHACHRGRR